MISDFILGRDGGVYVDSLVRFCGFDDAGTDIMLGTEGIEEVAVHIWLRGPQQTTSDPVAISTLSTSSSLNVVN